MLASAMTQQYAQLMDKSSNDGLLPNENRVMCIILLIVLEVLASDQASPGTDVI